LHYKKLNNTETKETSNSSRYAVDFTIIAAVKSYNTYESRPSYPR